MLRHSIQCSKESRRSFLKNIYYIILMRVFVLFPLLCVNELKWDYWLSSRGWKPRWMPWWCVRTSCWWINGGIKGDRWSLKPRLQRCVWDQAARVSRHHMDGRTGCWVRQTSEGNKAHTAPVLMRESQPSVLLTTAQQTLFSLSLALSCSLSLALTHTQLF